MPQTLTTPVETDIVLELRIPGDLFRAVNPRNFSYPPISAERYDAEWGEVYAVTAKVEGIPEAFDLLYDVNASWDDVKRLVAAFNVDPYAGWAPLLATFFREQRAANAEKRAQLDKDAAFLLDLEAGFLR